MNDEIRRSSRIKKQTNKKEREKKLKDLRQRLKNQINRSSKYSFDNNVGLFVNFQRHEQRMKYLMNKYGFPPNQKINDINNQKKLENMINDLEKKIKNTKARQKTSIFRGYNSNNNNNQPNAEQWYEMTGKWPIAR